MAMPALPSSSWRIARPTPEEMEAALARFESRELQELSSSHLPLFEIPDSEVDLDSEGDPGSIVDQL